ncbi:MAG TPA: GH25 family lysozyme [Kutzneria sp.]|nr:GH25 family lysozyme [Kutzneria sp.]
MTIYGWDASDFDWSRGPMDLAAARRDGITFFTHKATEGTSTQHKHLADRLDRARAVGIEFLGAYHVVRSGPSVAAQVAYFLAYLDAQVPWWRGYPGFFLQPDLERWSYDNVAASTGVAFCGALKAAQPKRVIAYASKGQYGDQLAGLAGLGVPLWNANYGANRAGHYRQAYPGDSGAGWAAYSGQTPVLWQYGSQLTIGSQPGCDANAFRGTLDDLRTLIMGDDMALRDDPDGLALIYREAALVGGKDTVADGPTKGEPVWTTATLKAIAAAVAAPARADDDVAALIYRVAALADGSPTVAGGPRAGEAVWLVAQVQELRAELEALKAALSAPVPVMVPTAADIAAQLIAQLQTGR